MTTFKSARPIIAGMAMGIVLYIVIDLLSIALVPELDPVWGLIMRVVILLVALIVIFLMMGRRLSKNPRA